jgi:iron complex outermembrane recepter protein
MRHTIAAAIAGLAAGLSVYPLSGRAQPPVDAVVIEATRFPDTARTLPASVTVIAAEDIAASPARTLPELLSQQAGIAMHDFFGNNAATTTVDLRGFGVTGAQNTLILVDGRRVTDIDFAGVQWAAIPLASIERVEILRGTGAVLYGDGASSGVINIVTRSPVKEGYAAEAWGRVGTFNTREGQIYGSVASGGFGANASVYGFSSDGYRANNRNEQQNNNVNLRWDIGATRVDARLGTDRQDLRLPGARRVQPSIGLDEYASDPRGAQTPLDFASRDGERAGLTLSRRWGETDATVGFDYRRKDQRSYFDQSGFPTSRADVMDVMSITPRVRIPLKTGAIAHRLTLGVDWHDWDYDSRRSDRPENAGRPINHVRVKQETRAFYAQDSIELSPATRLLLGWRKEQVRFDATDTVDPTAPGFFFNTAAPPSNQKQHATAWEVGLRHELSKAWSLYGRVGEAFRFVNVDEIYENDAFFNAQFQILNPQRSRTYEAGAEWRSDAVSLRGAVFRTDVKDEIHLDPFTTGVGNTNLPPSRRQGLELETRWDATRTLRIAGNYTYTDAKFREGVLAGSPFAIGTGLSVAGKRVPLVPEHKLNASVTWDATAKTRISAVAGWVSSQFMDNDEPNTLGSKIPSYAFADLKLEHRFGWGRVGLALNNVFDSYYYTYAVRSAFIPDRYAVYPLPGRTFALFAELRID